MQIMTSSGKTFEAGWALKTETRHGAKQLVIQMPGTNDPTEIMKELVGVDVIKGDMGDGEYKTYEGYTLFSSLIYSTDRKVLRLTLEKGDAA